MKKIYKKNCAIGAGLLLMGIMVITISAACGKREKSSDENTKKAVVTEKETESAQNNKNAQKNDLKVKNDDTGESDSGNPKEAADNAKEDSSMADSENIEVNENTDDMYTDYQNTDYENTDYENMDHENTDSENSDSEDQYNEMPDDEDDNTSIEPDETEQRRPHVDAGWIYYVSSAKNGMSSEQKAYFDALIGKWTRKEITDEDMHDEFLNTLSGEWGFDTSTAGIMSDSRCLFESVEAVPDYDEMIAESKGFYNFIGLYTEGEYDDKGYLICYYWEAGAM